MLQNIGDDALLRRRAFVELCNKAGYKITYGGACTLSHHGTGPKETRFNKELWYRLGDVRNWLEGRLGMTLLEAVKVGRLKPAPDHPDTLALIDAAAQQVAS